MYKKEICLYLVITVIHLYIFIFFKSLRWLWTRLCL